MSFKEKAKKAEKKALENKMDLGSSENGLIDSKTGESASVSKII